MVNEIKIFKSDGVIEITFDDSIVEKLDYLCDICKFSSYEVALEQIIIYTFDVFDCLNKLTQKEEFAAFLRDNHYLKKEQ